METRRRLDKLPDAAPARFLFSGVLEAEDAGAGDGGGDRTEDTARLTASITSETATLAAARSSSVSAAAIHQDRHSKRMKRPFGPATFMKA